MIQQDFVFEPVMFYCYFMLTYLQPCIFFIKILVKERSSNEFIIFFKGLYIFYQISFEHYLVYLKMWVTLGHHYIFFEPIELSFYDKLYNLLLE